MKKKFLAASLAVLIAFSCLTVCASVAELKPGDIDGNGTVTIEDARWALRCAIGLSRLTNDQLRVADYDANGEVDINDARLILRKAIGLEDAEKKKEEEQHRKELEEKGETEFSRVLYERSHAMLGEAKNYVTKDITGIMKKFQKWCCLYTIGDVIRPVLKELGYPQYAIDKLAPNSYPADLWTSLLKNYNVPFAGLYGDIASTMTDIYSPSVVMAYYQKLEKEGLAKIYNLVTYYDNDITGEIVPADKAEIAEYKPEIGDIVYITNKTMTDQADDGNYYNFLIHTAQITKVNEDGSFLCTEGSIIETKEGDGIARVRERTYHWKDNNFTNYDGYGKLLPDVPSIEFSTYVFDYNSTVVVQAIIRPDWSYGAPEGILGTK